MSDPTTSTPKPPESKATKPTQSTEVSGAAVPVDQGVRAPPVAAVPEAPAAPEKEKPAPADAPKVPPSEPQPAPVPPQPAPMIVSPSSVTLTGGQAQPFAVSPEQAVTWSLDPPNDDYYGKINAQSGAYTAPKWFITSRTAMVQARPQAGPPKTGTVTLNAEPFWRTFIGILLLALSIPIVWQVEARWPASSVCDYPPALSPSVAWTSSGFSVPFNLARCASAPPAVSWQVASGPGTVSEAGVYVAPVDPKLLADAVVQALDTDKKIIASASVHVTAGTRLTIWPAVASLGASQYQIITVSSSANLTDVSWSLDQGLGDLKPVDTVAKPSSVFQQKYLAPDPISKPAIVRVIATIGAGSPDLSGHSISTTIQLNPDQNNLNNHPKRIFWFVFWMGLLGSYIHTTGSFAAFVGNRKFLTDWGWWYVLRHLSGGFLAVLVFFLLGGGFFGKADIASPYLVATYAGLVGLFSETALLKLKEIIETILKPKDERSGTLANGGAAANAKPLITSVLVEDAAQRKYAVTGSNFASSCRVRVNGKDHPALFVNDSKLTFALDEAEKGVLQIVVSRPKGDGTNDDSTPFPLTVA